MYLYRLSLLLVPVVLGCGFRIEEDRGDVSPAFPTPPDLPVAPPSPSSSASPPPSVGAGNAIPIACGGSIDPFKELLVTDPAILASNEARNDVAGAAFSFRSRLEELSVRAEDTAAFAVSWLESWKSTTEVGGVAAVQPRYAVESVLVDPWRQGAGSSMSALPFRLIAIVNRIDLSGSADGCAGEAGEIRFVYTALDPYSGRAIAMTVIVEIPYPSTRSPRAWAQAWHALSSLPSGASYVAGLAELVHEVGRAADPERTRIRTNEVALGNPQNRPWELRQFALTVSEGEGSLAPTLIVTTPRDDLDDSPSLTAWVDDHRDRLARGTTDDLPIAMQAGASSMADASFRWSIASVAASESARRTFSQSTCNGCHAGERPDDGLLFQHLAPSDAPNGDGYYSPSPGSKTRISTFLYDGRGGGDLVRRAQSMARILCSSCAPGSGPAVPQDPLRSLPLILVESLRTADESLRRASSASGLRPR